MDVSENLLFQGAEGRVYESLYLGKPAIIKERLKKSYRVPELDQKINKQRLLQEARCMVKCRRAGVVTPCIYLVDVTNNRLYQERIIGQTFKQLLWLALGGAETSSTQHQTLIDIAKGIGIAIGTMHDAEIVHGDLTTSNIMIRDSNTDGSCKESATSAASAKPNVFSSVVLIDFGLGMLKPTLEDKAVDLYVLERAFISTHPGSGFLVDAILTSYRFNSRKGTHVLVKLEQVRQRGRKRDMTG